MTRVWRSTLQLAGFGFRVHFIQPYLASLWIEGVQGCGRGLGLGSVARSGLGFIVQLIQPILVGLAADHRYIGRDQASQLCSIFSRSSLLPW